MSRGSVAVVGGSIAGLAAANVLAQRGFEVTVFERFPTGFESRGGGLGGVDRQLYESIRADGATLRQHGPGGWFYGDLWRYLRGGLADDAVRHGVAVADVGDVAAPTVDGAAYDFVVVADGGWSSLRRFVVGDQQPVYSGYCLWRGLMDLERAPSFRSFGGHRTGYFDTGGFPISCADGRTLYNGGFYLPFFSPRSRSSSWAARPSRRSTRGGRCPTTTRPSTRCPRAARPRRRPCPSRCPRRAARNSNLQPDFNVRTL